MRGQQNLPELDNREGVDAFFPNARRGGAPVITKARFQFRKQRGFFGPLKNGIQDGLFCMTCWDADKQLIRLKHEEDFGYICQICTDGYPESPGLFR